jgi:tetratricopeptide (TPR) repeat protein
VNFSASRAELTQGPNAPGGAHTRKHVQIGEIGKLFPTTGPLSDATATTLALSTRSSKIFKSTHGGMRHGLSHFTRRIGRASRSGRASARAAWTSVSRLERLETRSDQQTRIESKTQLVEQIKTCLRSGEYSRVLDLVRGTAAEYPNDAELSGLERLAQDGVQRNAEAQRLITESQELFAQQKSAEAIQLLRKAYELDKNNSLARTILANALVEHAHSIVETDWLKAETLTNQALALNPAHPTAKTILSLIVYQKKTSSVEDWVSQARKLQSSGDLFAALAWVAEGLAVHPHDPKLLQIQDEIQRDQDARRRKARRGDLEDLRHLQREIDGAIDAAAKQALAVRIQTVAAKHWTDGEILSIANALLLRLGLVSKESSSTSPRGKSATVILHVPRPSAPEASRADTSTTPPSQAAPSEVPPSIVPESPAPPQRVPTAEVPPSPVPPQDTLAATVPPSTVPSKAPPSTVRPRNAPTGIAPPRSIPATQLKAQIASPQAATVLAAEPSIPAAKVTSPSPRLEKVTRSKTKTLILVSTAAMILVAATFFFTREHYAPPVPKTQSATSTGAAPTASAPVATTPAVPTPTVSSPAASAPAVSAPAQTTLEPSPHALQPSSDTVRGRASVPDHPKDVQPPAESGRNLGTLLVVTGQDDAKIFLNGKLQRQLTQAGQLRLQNLELQDYVVQISKSGFQDPPPQRIRIREGEDTRLIFSLQPLNLQPQPRMASLTIQGGVPGTTVLVDQTLVGTIQPDGTLSVSTVNPGDHTVELRKDRFKPRQFKEHFVAGGAISLAAADAALEAVPGVLTITFAPADANVAIVKGDLLKMVSSGVPLNLAAGTYTLTARTADRFTRSSTLEIVAGQSKTLTLSLAPNGMSKWDDPGAWKQEKDSFIRKGGDFVLYRAVPASGTFNFSAMPAKGHLLQWVLNYTDSKNYVLFQMDDNNFYRTVIRNGERTDQIKVPDKSDKKSFRTLQIRVSSTELVHQIKHANSWTVLDRWTQPGVDLSQGKFGFYIPGNDEMALSSFAHYADLNIR